MTTPPVTTSVSLKPWKDLHPSQDIDPFSNRASTLGALQAKTNPIVRCSANGRVYEFIYWVLPYPHADPRAPITYEVGCVDPPEILAHCDDDVWAGSCFDFPSDSPVRLDLVCGLSLDLAVFSTVLDAKQKRFSLHRCTHVVLSSRRTIDLGSFLEDIRTAGTLTHWLDLPHTLEIRFGDASAANVGFSNVYPPVPADMDDTMVGNALTSTLTTLNRGADCRSEGPERLPSLAAVFDPWGREWKLAKSGKGFELAAGADCTYSLEQSL